MSVATASGLEGVQVAETLISEVDGERGRLVIAGYDAERLATMVTFEEVCHLLWTGKMPDKSEKEALAHRFGVARVSAYELLKQAPFVLQQTNPMDSLRSAVSLLNGNIGCEVADYVPIAASIPVFAAAWWRKHKELPLVAPDTNLTESQDFLRMLTGNRAPDNFAKALNIYLTTVTDHGMNASTFTARVVASTASDNVSCVVAGIGALKGPLHGGAPGPVLAMLTAIGTADGAAAWIENELDSGRRIMGMGHRIYRVRDPRAAIFEAAISRLEDEGVEAPRLSLARAVERTAEEILAKRHPERPLKANVEFYTAVLLDLIGVPQELFSCAFAMGRVAGWLAHVSEQRKVGKLIRPASTYVGAHIK